MQSWHAEGHEWMRSWTAPLPFSPLLSHPISPIFLSSFLFLFRLRGYVQSRIRIRILMEMLPNFWKSSVTPQIKLVYGAPQIPHFYFHPLKCLGQNGATLSRFSQPVNHLINYLGVSLWSREYEAFRSFFPTPGPQQLLLRKKRGLIHFMKISPKVSKHCELPNPIWKLSNHLFKFRS